MSKSVINIPYSSQWIEQADIDAVVNVLKSPHLTQGPLVKKFEEKIAKYCGAKYAVAVSSGTAALHTACLAAGIQEGDEVITSPITFVASANCVLYCGGRPVFADVADDTFNIDPREIEKKINKNTKAIIPVHFAGHPADLKKIREIASKNDLIVIEDAAHALGAEYRGPKIGSGQFSDMTIFSFHPVKSITTGEGGAILTNDKNLYDKLLMFRSHGIIKDAKLLLDSPGSWYYEMRSLGFNYRITDIQCALGISQLKRLDRFIKRRREIVEVYNCAFKRVEWIDLLAEREDSFSAFHIYVILLDFVKIKKSRRKVMNYLKEQGIGTQVHYIPVYMHPYYKGFFGYKGGECCNAERYYKKALTLPLYPKMTDQEVNYVIEKVLSVYE